MLLISASMGYAVTWIMSQRILIHLRGECFSSISITEAHNIRFPELSEPAELARFENIILTRPLHPGRPVVAELRSQCEMQKSAIDAEYSASSPRDLELDVRVHVEQSVAVEYDQLSKKRLTGEC